MKNTQHRVTKRPTPEMLAHNPAFAAAWRAFNKAIADGTTQIKAFDAATEAYNRVKNGKGA